MAANGRGHMRPNSGGKSPPFVVIGLLVVIAILAFNYWSLSSKNNLLSMDVEEVGMKYRSTQAKKIDVEKRNAELSSLLAEAQKYKIELSEKTMKLQDAAQKENELNSKMGNLAGEAEILRNDLNKCDDDVVCTVTH
jgi:chromosome segregation ATPase